MRAYDNITNFIKWCRHCVKVRECLMFETEDLALCKNEKNFILCLLEVARFGSRFGIQVPTIIQLEQEIEAEMALDTQTRRILDERDGALVNVADEEESCARVVEQLVEDAIVDDSLNKSGSSFEAEFVPLGEAIEENKNGSSNDDLKQSSKLDWSQTSSSGCQIDELSNEELSNKNGKISFAFFRSRSSRCCNLLTAGAYAKVRTCLDGSVLAD